MNGASVIVIGGGATGLSAAWWLARDGVDVLVLDKGLVAWEASGRNGGGCSHHFSPLFAEEQRLWPLMDGLLGYPTEYTRSRVRIARSPEQWAQYQLGPTNAARQGFRTEVIDAKQIAELAPLAGPDCYAGHLCHWGGHANPHRTVQAYAWALQDLGGKVMQQTAVRGFERSGERVTAVETDAGTFGCDTLVIAAGPHTGALAQALGTAVPMVPARAEMIVTEPLPLMPETGVDGNGLYGRQTRRGNLAYGGGPHEWLADTGLDRMGLGAPSRAATPLMQNMAARLAQMFPLAAHARLIRSWAGIIENTPDGRPVIDRLPTCPNAIVATMSSIGFGLSPATGHVIRDLVQDGACSFADVSSFRLERFSRLEPDWREQQGWLAA
jgi:sarcosine oxidase subunit beta